MKLRPPERLVDVDVPEPGDGALVEQRSLQRGATAGQALFVPAEPSQRSELVQLFMLDKALYELNYELNNRPDWVRIPLAAIMGLL